MKVLLNFKCRIKYITLVSKCGISNGLRNCCVLSRLKSLTRETTVLKQVKASKISEKQIKQENIHCFCNIKS